MTFPFYSPKSSPGRVAMKFFTLDKNVNLPEARRPISPGFFTSKPDVAFENLRGEGGTHPSWLFDLVKNSVLKARSRK